MKWRRVGCWRRWSIDDTQLSSTYRRWCLIQFAYLIVHRFMNNKFDFRFIYSEEWVRVVNIAEWFKCRAFQLLPRDFSFTVARGCSRCLKKYSKASRLLFFEILVINWNHCKLNSLFPPRCSQYLRVNFGNAKKKTFATNLKNIKTMKIKLTASDVKLAHIASSFYSPSIQQWDLCWLNAVYMQNPWRVKRRESVTAVRRV